MRRPHGSSTSRRTETTPTPAPQAAPYLTINRAAQEAQPGDTVVVHAGLYRETVKPARGGTDETHRITYTNAGDGEVVVKGSEEINSWARTERQRLERHAAEQPSSATTTRTRPGSRRAARAASSPGYTAGDVYLDEQALLREARAERRAGGARHLVLAGVRQQHDDLGQLRRRRPERPARRDQRTPADLRAGRVGPGLHHRRRLHRQARRQHLLRLPEQPVAAAGRRDQRQRRPALDHPEQHRHQRPHDRHRHRPRQRRVGRQPARHHADELPRHRQVRLAHRAQQLHREVRASPASPASSRGTPRSSTT